MRSRSQRSLRENGSVLVIVLVTLLFATVALVAFVERASDDLTVEAREVTGRRLRQDAYSALEVTLGVLEDFRQVDGGLRSPAEGWDDPLGFAGWEPPSGRLVEVAFEDESGKLSLPHAELATLVNLFKGWGLPQSEADRLGDAMMGWMRKEHVASSMQQPDYEHSSPPYEAPFRPLRSYSELAAIDFVREKFFDDNGLPNELWHRFVGAISLFDFKETNLNGMDGSLLDDLGIIDDSQKRQFQEYRQGTGSRSRQGPGFFETPADAAAVLGPNVNAGYGTQISALRINVTVTEGRTVFRLSVVVAPSSGGAKLVEQTAEGGSAKTVSDGQAAPSKGAAGPNSENQAGAKKLNYPFTLLEIRENAEISVASASPTKA